MWYGFDSTAKYIKHKWTKWYMKWIIYWTADKKSSEATILTVMNAILAISAKKSLKNSGLQRGLNSWLQSYPKSIRGFQLGWLVSHQHHKSWVQSHYSLEFFRLLNPIIAKVAFTTVRIIAWLDFISAASLGISILVLYFAVEVPQQCIITPV